MSNDNIRLMAEAGERIDVKHDYALCTWAKRFNVSEKRVQEAVAAVGDRADQVRKHLQSPRPAHQAGQERPLSS